MALIVSVMSLPLVFDARGRRSECELPWSLLIQMLANCPLVHWLEIVLLANSNGWRLLVARTTKSVEAVKFGGCEKG
jgi:hypothetical protein